jgi:phosphoribosylformylglycinamidine synthase
LLGGDNYRIGMGGGAVSSVATGEFENKIELNAVQRANPEMQKRVYNAIRALGRSENNPIVSIHDHGAGGHLNCLSELVEDTGGIINIDQLPVGDPTLSLKEIVGNESQERMGLVIKEEYIETFAKIAERERAPLYVIGDTTNDMKFCFEKKPAKNPSTGNWNTCLAIRQKHSSRQKGAQFANLNPIIETFTNIFEKVLQLENVACKDWLTNKVDRSVTGRIAKQQCAGKIATPVEQLGSYCARLSRKKWIGNSTWTCTCSWFN